MTNFGSELLFIHVNRKWRKNWTQKYQCSNNNTRVELTAHPFTAENDT